MMAPVQYVEQFKNASCVELLKFKNELVSCISEFEHDFDREETGWSFDPSSDVGYQWNLEVLGLIAPMLREAFNMEYEEILWGVKKQNAIL